MSDTPRTDSGSWHTRIPGDPAGADVVYQSLARTLERELAAAHQRIAELEKDRARLDWLNIEPNCDKVGSWMSATGDIRAAIDAAMSK